jgi:hypothetical protein
MLSRAVFLGWITSACSTAALHFRLADILDQADGTAWMAPFCQNMLEVAVQLAGTSARSPDTLVSAMEHFLWIASALMHEGDTGMWEDDDGFFYNLLRLRNGQPQRLNVHSMVGLLPCVPLPYSREKQFKNIPICLHGCTGFFTVAQS